MVFALVSQTEIAGLEGWPFAKSYVFVTVDQPDTAVIALPRVSLAPTNLARFNPVVGRTRLQSEQPVTGANTGRFSGGRGRCALALIAISTATRQ